MVCIAPMPYQTAVIAASLHDGQHPAELGKQLPGTATRQPDQLGDFGGCELLPNSKRGRDDGYTFGWQVFRVSFVHGLEYITNG
jgi:hypothetical protein